MFFVVRSNDSFNFPLGLIQYIVIVSSISFSPSFSVYRAKETLVPYRESFAVVEEGFVVYIVKTFFSMFVGTTTFCTNFLQDMCVLLKLQLKAPMLKCLPRN